MNFEVIVYSEQFEVGEALAPPNMIAPPKVNRTIECRLIIDPFQAKSIVQWLTAQVNAFERQFGHIPSAEEIQQQNLEQEKKKTVVFLRQLLLRIIAVYLNCGRIQVCLRYTTVEFRDSFCLTQDSQPRFSV
jgi:hypothetical protein